MPTPKRSQDETPLQNDAVNHDEDNEEHQNDDVEDEDIEERQQNDDVEDDEDEDEDEDGEEGEDEDGDEGEDEEDEVDEEISSSSSDDDTNDLTNEELPDIRKEVQCPICLGIIRKTRTVMECLHRFCRECIDKSMRLGNNECPACRTHCASRRSLRDDPNYDALISAIYPDIDQYEEEELAFQEDERVRNKQIQAAIAQTFRRQTEALSKKRKRSQGIYRRRRNYRSEEEEDANGHDGGKESSSADERCTEPKPKRPKKWRGQPPSPATCSDARGDENDQEVHREAPAALIGSAEMLAWGKGGIRSNTRHGGGTSGNGKHSRSRIARLNEHLRNMDENDNELDIQVVLVSLDGQKEPLLEHSYLSGRPTLSVGQLCQFIALQTSLPPEKLEILGVRGRCSETDRLPTMQESSSSTSFEGSKDELQVLDSKETLAELKAACNFARGHLLLAYRQKL